MEDSSSGKGMLIVFSGPSGVGKGTVLSRVMGRRKNLKLSVSYTTRKPREGEVDGINYHFVSESEFLKIVDSSGMLEYAKYCGNYYGTPRAAVEKELELGNNVILEIEVQGGEQVLKKCPDAIGIFVIPPSVSELKDRLKSRAAEEEEIMARRVEEYKREIDFSRFYDYVVVNGCIEDCASNILKIIDSQSMRFKYMKPKVEEVLKDA